PDPHPAPDPGSDPGQDHDENHDGDQALRDLAALTPAQLAGEIRADAGQVYTAAQAWRRSPQWTGSKQDRKAYDSIAVMKAELDALPEPASHHDVYQYVKPVGPVLGQYWPDHAG